jgi:hypothetical protein
MPQVLVQFDDPTVKAIDRIARAAKPKRADFIRRTVKDEIFRLETERMREAYRLQPDSAEDADTWDLPEEWKERSSSRCGLAKACVADCRDIRVVPKLSLTKRAGELAPERWVEVRRAVGAALGWRELTDLN